MNPKKHKDLLNKKNVVAVAKGEKWTKGKNTGEEALLVFVDKKVPKDQLSSADLIPEKINGQKTDVVGKTGTIVAQSFTQRVRPIPGGYSCGHLEVTAGTMGGWFLDNDGDLVGLSNNHVLANENNAIVAGQHFRGKERLGDTTLQPGVYDNRRWKRNRVGRLKSFVRLTDKNFQDAAIFKVKNKAVVDPEIHLIGQPVGFRDDVKVGDVVQKTGRTTRHTTNKVIATDGVVRVQYGRSLGVLDFEDQIITNDMSRGGDSGSLLLDMNNNIVGLLFAGSNTVTIHNKIKYPREQWGLKIYNPNPLEESFTATLTVNGTNKTIPEMGDLNSLVAKSRKLAKEGKTVSLDISYQVNQK